MESHEANRERQLLESLELLESHGAIVTVITVVAIDHRHFIKMVKKKKKLSFFYR